MSSSSPDRTNRAPATTFVGSAQRLWKITARSDEPWRQYRQAMTAMTLTPFAWLLVLAHHIVLGPPLLVLRLARRVRARRAAG